MGVNNPSSVASNGITREQFLSTLENKDENVKNKAIEILITVQNHIKMTTSLTKLNKN